jgi:hypothetical protein
MHYKVIDIMFHLANLLHLYYHHQFHLLLIQINHIKIHYQNIIILLFHKIIFLLSIFDFYIDFLNNIFISNLNIILMSPNYLLQYFYHFFLIIIHMYIKLLVLKKLNIMIITL